MLLQLKDSPAFKEWLIPKIQPIFDSPGELADYVIVLLGGAGSAEDIKQNCVEALAEFLDDRTQPFVDEVIEAVVSKSWVPSAAAPAAPAVGLPIPTYPPNAPTEPLAQRNGGQSRKRKHESHGGQAMGRNASENNKRPSNKTTRTVRSDMSRGFTNSGIMARAAGQGAAPNVPQMPVPIPNTIFSQPTGFAPMDIFNMWALFAPAWAAMGFPVPPFSPDAVQAGQGPTGQISEALDDDIDFEEIRKRVAEAQKKFKEMREKRIRHALMTAKVDKELSDKEREIRDWKLKLLEKGGQDALEELEQQIAGLPADERESAREMSILTQSYIELPNTQRPGDHGDGGFSYRRGRYGGGYTRPSYTPPHWKRENCGVWRLDNRPKRLAIFGVVPHSETDKALRGYLLADDGCDAIGRHTEHNDTLVVSFKERWMATKFVNDVPHIPDVGELEMDWIPNDAAVVVDSTKREPMDYHPSTDTDVDAGMEIKEEYHDSEPDFDVAEASDEYL